MARLKRGSAAAKAWGRKMKRLRSGSKSKFMKKSSHSSTHKRGKVIKRRSTRMPKKRRMHRRKTSSMFGINTSKALAAGIYGAGRARLSNLLAPFTSRIPLGNVGDEVGMVVGLQLLKKFAFKKAGVLREAATAGQAIEFARIGEAVASGNIGINIGSGGSSSGNLF